MSDSEQVPRENMPCFSCRLVGRCYGFILGCPNYRHGPNADPPEEEEP